jgi:hypothetical protein
MNTLDPTRPEMSTDHRFRARLSRLVGVSAVALGLILWAAASTTNVGGWFLGCLAAGWVMMPILLWIGRDRPAARWGLMVPATLVVVGLAGVLSGLAVGSAAFWGWALVTAGILVGAGLGGWFWYRFVPVPDGLADPFAASRWWLIALHAGLVVVGLVVAVLA